MPSAEQGGFSTIIGGSCHKYHFCRDKKKCNDKHVFVVTKHKTFVATKIVFCRDNHVFIATKLRLSRQNLCRDTDVFVATNIILSRQRLFLSRQTSVCRDKCVCGDKTILVAAPANDSQRITCRQKCLLHQFKTQVMKPKVC